MGLNKVGKKQWSIFLVIPMLLLGCVSKEIPSEHSETFGAPLVVKEFDSTSTNSNPDAPYVVLVSIDGFRYDYAKKYGAKNLLDVGTQGITAESLIPVFPSKTFPNHYSIITGLYADEHGIVSNNFFDPKLNEEYHLGDKMANEGKWYFGEPMWVTAEKNGMRTATCFWVGSEALVQNRLPNYYAVFSDQVAHQTRVDQIIEWLKLPAAKRPHFLTLYFSTVDTAGHKFGPESKEVSAAVQSIDQTLGDLRKKLKATGLPINLIVVSDHGMLGLDAKKVLGLDSVDLAGFKVAEAGVLMSLHLKPGQSKSLLEKTQKAIQALNLPLQVFKRNEMELQHYSKSHRTGDLTIVPNSGYQVYQSTGIPDIRNKKGGAHGWDPATEKYMHGIFFAEGPDFKKGVVLPSIQNVNIYPLMAKVLRLEKIPKVSGSVAPFEAMALTSVTK